MAELVLKLKGDFSFAKADQRADFVAFVSGLLSAGGRAFEPIPLNAATTDLEWSVERGNDWWVFFDRDDKKRVRIKHRYDAREALVPMGAWISYRYRCEVVTPEYKLELTESA